MIIWTQKAKLWFCSICWELREKDPCVGCGRTKSFEMTMRQARRTEVKEYRKQAKKRKYGSQTSKTTKSR